MAGQFSVNTENMRTTAAQIRAYAQEYESIANKLMQTAQQVGSVYQSADAQVFLTQIQGCHNDLKAMVAKLNLVSQTLEQQTKNYETVSSHNSQQARKLGN